MIDEIIYRERYSYRFIDGDITDIPLKEAPPLVCI